MVKALIGRLIKGYIVENEEFSFGTKISLIRDPTVLEVDDRTHGDGAWIFFIFFTSNGILDITDQVERGKLSEWINERGICLRQNQHVTFIDRLPSADA